MKLDRRKAFFIAGAALISGFLTGSPALGATTVSPQEAHEIAAEAYAYFYPLVTMDVTRRVATNTPAGKLPGFGPANAFSQMRTFPPADFKAVVRPNFDTLYSSAWLDLTKGPVLLSVPDTQDRYYLLPMLDMWTDVFAVPGKRTSGTKAGLFAVTREGWKGELPKGAQRIDAPTNYVWIIGRTQTNGPADYEAVHRVQDGYKLTPLAEWGKEPIAPTAVVDPAVDIKTPPKAQVDTMKPEAYFRYASELLKTNPPHVTDWSVVERIKRIGIEAGKPFDMASLDPVARAAVEQGAADAAKLIAEKISGLGDRVLNGWSINTDTMGVYGNFYLKRASIARRGLGANPPEDAVYPLLVADADGAPLTGEHGYRIHFSREQLPPVNAFWSLTLYDAEGYPVANSINRHAIGDRDPLKYNADGSLDIFIRHDDPGAEHQSNWLPSPSAGPINITMRLYGPRAEILDGSWAPPPVTRQP
jgi:hypothetical protein